LFTEELIIHEFHQVELGNVELCLNLRKLSLKLLPKIICFEKTVNDI